MGIVTADDVLILLRREFAVCEGIGNRVDAEDGR